MTLQTGMRTGAEEALVRELTKRGMVGIPGNTLVAVDTLQDREKTEVLLKRAGTSGAVIMRLMGRNSKTQESPRLW